MKKIIFSLVVIVSIIILLFNGNNSFVILTSSSMSTTLQKIIDSIPNEKKKEIRNISISGAATGTIISQIQNGVNADIFFIHDDTALIYEYADTPLTIIASDVLVFASNIKSRNIKENINTPLTFSDLQTPSVPFLLGICSKNAFCGKLTRTFFAEQNITPHITTNEPNVASLTLKLASGELDAGFIYHSNVHQHNNTLRAIKTPMATSIYAGILSSSTNKTSAEYIIDYIVSKNGQQILNDNGFTTKQ